MFYSKKSSAQYICLITLIFIQILVANSQVPIQCIQCGSNDTNKCTGKEEFTACSQGITKCFTKIDGKGDILRGCMTEEIESSCKIDDSNNCVNTDSKKNNQLICKKCEATDDNCSQTDMTNNDIKYNQICDNTATKCLVKVENKLVVRRCANESDVTGCTDPNTCKACDTSACNTGIFPPNRLSCYQCNENSCNTVTNVQAKTCLKYEEKDECYTKSDNATSMIRGCKSDTKDNKCAANAAGCTFCNTTDCNSEAYQFTCIICRSDENKKCWNDANNIKGDNCRIGNSSAAEGCFHGIWHDVAIRGCVIDATIQNQELCKDKNNNQCNICNAKDCNTGKSGGGKNAFSYSIMLIVLISLLKLK